MKRLNINLFFNNEITDTVGKTCTDDRVSILEFVSEIIPSCSIGDSPTSSYHVYLFDGNEQRLVRILDTIFPVDNSHIYVCRDTEKKNLLKLLKKETCKKRKYVASAVNDQTSVPEVKREKVDHGKTPQSRLAYHLKYKDDSVYKSKRQVSNLLMLLMFI
tara:strand:+ start:418 stop:897 length:480 start_codon:yes stop_codon:yes gene_type:complete